MNRNRYVIQKPAEITVREIDGRFLAHKWDAYEQRRNYDKQKRHERYIRDRDAGKTGYKGGWSRYRYRPTIAVAKRKREDPQPQEQPEEQPEEQPQEQSQSSGGGGGSSGGGGGDDADRAAIAEARQKMQEDIAQVREMLKSDKADTREDAKQAIERLRDEIKEESEAVKQAIEEDRDKKKLERENQKEQSSINIEKEKDTKEANIENDTEKLKTDLKGKTDPIREKIAELRGKLDSTSDPSEVKRLSRLIAKNKDEINDENAKYTQSVTKVRNEHTVKMQTNIAKIRTDLQTFINKSITEQNEKATKLRSELKELRDSNNKEIKEIRECMKKALEKYTQAAKLAIEKIKAGEGDGEIYVENSHSEEANKVYRAAKGMGEYADYKRKHTSATSNGNSISGTLTKGKKKNEQDTLGTEERENKRKKKSK